MLRYGEYSPNNPQIRVTAAPYLGIGEYEQRRNHFLHKQKADYLKHLAKENDSLREVRKTVGVQTELQDIRVPIVQYDLSSLEEGKGDVYGSKLKSYRGVGSQNALLTTVMDKPKSILSNRRTGSPRDRYLSDYSHNFLDGFSYSDRSEELERERLKRENYQHELRLQIEEKRRIQAMREEQERREQELENRRLEQQLLRLQEEQMIEDQRRSRREEMRRHSEDYLRRKLDFPTSVRHSYRKHTDSESSVLRSNDFGKSHYSPPVSRKHFYSYTLPSTSMYDSARYGSSRFDYRRGESCDRNPFNRFDSLSRIDSLSQRFDAVSLRDGEFRRHSATQQDLSLLRRSPKLTRRSSSGRFDDTLPIPVLKAHSPVAKELKNSIPFNSSRSSSEAVRKLEDKWQIPAVQKNIVTRSESPRDGQCRNILTQLGAIRMQLQQAQLQMDETLKSRGNSQTKAVNSN